MIMEEKWEYKIIPFKLDKDQMDIVGLHGWELVSYTKTIVWLFCYNHQYIFKRKIQEG